MDKYLINYYQIDLPILYAQMNTCWFYLLNKPVKCSKINLTFLQSVSNRQPITYILNRYVDKWSHYESYLVRVEKIIICRWNNNIVTIYINNFRGDKCTLIEWDLLKVIFKSTFCIYGFFWIHFLYIQSLDK